MVLFVRIKRHQLTLHILRNITLNLMIDKKGTQLERTLFVRTKRPTLHILRNIFFLKVTAGRGENPPPEFHSLALEWPIKWVKKFYSILILWLHCGFKGSTPGHANSKITLR